MSKTTAYFGNYSEYDLAVPENIFSASDPSKLAPKDDKTLDLARNFWQKEYKGTVITQYHDSSRDLYLAQLRILLKKLHKIMQGYVTLVPQSSIADADFRLNDAKIAYFGEGAGESKQQPEEWSELKSLFIIHLSPKGLLFIYLSLWERSPHEVWRVRAARDRWWEQR